METTAAILNSSDAFLAVLMFQTMNSAAWTQESSIDSSGTILEAAKTPLDEEDEDEDPEEDDDEDEDLEDDEDLDDEDEDEDLEDDEDDDDDEDVDDELEDDDDPKPLRVKSRA